MDVGIVPPVIISPEALEAFRHKLQARGLPGAFIRLGVRGGACAGFSYVIEFEDKPDLNLDKSVSWHEGDVGFVVDKKSAIILAGCRVVWHRELMREGFDFENPREATRCGCGHSFSVGR